LTEASYLFLRGRMRIATTTALIVLSLLAAGVAAQTGPGRISGVLTGARGPIPNAEVRVKNATTDQVIVATTSATGEFSVAVPAGSYDVFSSTVGYAVLARRGVAVAAGATVRVDARLADNANAGTPGEIFFLYARADREPPTGPAPRTADGKPDLSGVWYPGPDLEPEAPPMLAWAEELFKKRNAKVGDDPRAQCLPSGIVRTHGLDLAKLVQTPTLLVMLVESSVPGVRQVFLDGRPHPPNVQPSWLGHSIGRWEGDTLVIDTIGLNDRVWQDLQGRPQTEKAHIIERYRRPDLGHLEVEITIDDPGAYTRPWKVRRLLELAPGEEILEYICNENHKTEHFVN
jgi:hypothetical protein